MITETFTGFVRRIVRAFNRSGLQYMLTGALAVTYYSRPRTTLDIDVVVALERKDLPALTSLLSKAGFKVQKKTLLVGWQSEFRIATIEDRKSPHTLDIMFADHKLERSQGRILGLPTYYQNVESLILAKLRMLKVTIQAERAATDREDIKAIMAATGINMRRLRRRARAESTLKLLQDLIS